MDASNDVGGSSRQMMKRPYDVANTAAANSAMASWLPQDLIDNIVECTVGDDHMFGLLRLREVCDAWGKAVETLFRSSRFECLIRESQEILLSYACSRKNRIAHRVHLVLWRNCEAVQLNLRSTQAVAAFERLLAPVAKSSAPIRCRRAPPQSVRPWAPFVTRLDLHNSRGAVGNNVMRRLAALLPGLRALDIARCNEVTDINTFARHGLTELDISGDCGVDTDGMSQLFYIKALRMNSRSQGPVLLDHIAGQLTDLEVGNCCSVRGYRTSQLDSSTTLLSSNAFVMSRLTRLDANSTSFKLANILDVTPALTDLCLDYVTASDDGPRSITIPPGVPLRRLNLERSNMRVNLEHSANTLTELDVRSTALGNDILVGLRALETLRMSFSDITCLKPVATTLTTLEACTISDAAFAHMKKLRTLDVVNNRNVTSLLPLADTLTELDASGSYCGITDASLVPLRCLRTLNVNRNTNVSTIAPFADTLTELHADGVTGLAEVDLGIARNLVTLSARGVDCSIGDMNLKSCSTLTSLNCADNSKITTIRPFIDTLERITGARLTHTCIPRQELRAAPRLKHVY